MEKLTITRLGEPKTINFTDKKTGQPKSFQKVGFQTQEYGERWFDFAFDTTHSLKVGETYEMETKSREYNGKTYYDAKFPKKNGGSSSEVMHELQVMQTTLGNIKHMVGWLYEREKHKVDFPGEPNPEDVKF